MKPIRVMIVEDSLVVRELLRHILVEDGRFEVVAAVESAEVALTLLERLLPDVISLDIRLPGMNGLDATLRIMETRPTPIVVVSASVERDDLNIAMNALRAGALTVVEKPLGTSHEDYRCMAQRLCTQLAIMSQVKVVRQVIRRRLSFGSAPPPADPAPREAERRPSPVGWPADPAMLGLVASTGGPSALSRILTELPADFPLPILLVQHITPSFLDGFVTWLNGLCEFEVKLAVAGELPQPGCVYLAPPDRHLELRQGRLWPSTAAAVTSQRPSGTVLFRSMASELGPRAIGVLLTGMGSDGADGLLALSRAGGHTIAEAESTAVVFGMPAAAVELGAAAEVLPLHVIAGRLRQLTMRRVEAGG